MVKYPRGALGGGSAHAGKSLQKPDRVPIAGSGTASSGGGTEERRFESTERVIAPHSLEALVARRGAVKND